MVIRKKTSSSARATKSVRRTTTRVVKRKADDVEPEPTPPTTPRSSRPATNGASTKAATAPPRFAPASAPAVAAPRSGPRPVVVARGEDPVRVFSETLKHSGFFDAIENAQIKSGKKRELFEVACKVDFMRGVRVEPEPVSYVDPKLVSHLFNELLDRGFRILRVVEVRGELSRYVKNRSVKEVGKVLGYDESCYELKELGDELVPIDLGPPVGRRATGRIWKQADFRIVFAKNRTDELFGPALVLWNLWHTLATPTDLVGMEYGIDPGDFALAMLEKVPAHFALIDAIHSRDGTPGDVFPYELLRATDGKAQTAADGAQLHRLGTVIAGGDVLAVEAAGQKMQGLDPLADPIGLRKLRKATGWKPPAEVDALPAFPGWKGIGTRIRELLGSEKPAENTRLSIYASLTQADGRAFPPHASGFQAIRLRQKVEAMVDELRRRAGSTVAAGAAGAMGGSPPDFDGGEDDEDEGDPPTFP